MTERRTVVLPSVGLDDPHLCTDSHAVLTLRRLLFQGLVAYDGTTLRGALAEGWEIDDDGRRWVFHLREGARFPGGRECSSADVAYSLKRAASPEAQGQLFTVTWHPYIGRAEIQTPDRTTVTLHNPDPIADLGELLPDLAIVPAGWQSYSDGTGTGPWTVKEHGGGRVVLHRRNAAAAEAGLPVLLEVRGEPDATARCSAVRAGRADLALDPGPGELDPGRETAELEAAGWDTCLSVVFFIDCRVEPLSDARVRRALNLAVDREGMIDRLLRGRAKPLNGVFSDRHFGRDPRLAPYPFDPQQARALLREAGVAEGTPVAINAPSCLPDEGPALAALLAEACGEAGLAARVVLHPERVEYARKVAAKELSGLCCFDSSPLSTYKVLHEKLDSRFAGTWWQGFHHDGVNDLLSRAAATPNTATRRQLYWHIYRILHDEAPWVFLYQPRRFWFRHRGRAAGIGIDDLGFLAL